MFPVGAFQAFRPLSGGGDGGRAGEALHGGQVGGSSAREAHPSGADGGEAELTLVLPFSPIPLGRSSTMSPQGGLARRIPRRWSWGGGRGSRTGRAPGFSRRGWLMRGIPGLCGCSGGSADGGRFFGRLWEALGRSGRGALGRER